MEYIYPEIALKQPKADPRTLLLHKRIFLESSSDHVQEEEHFNESSCQHTTTAKCDKLTCLCKNSPTATKETTLVFKTSLASSLLLSKSSSSLLPTFLVNFAKSCHFSASLNNLYKLQNTKLLFFLLFIWCAIFLQTTQAIPVRRTTTSGRKLILHTNVYRERYHQKLLEERNQHNQHQQLLQLQQQQLQEIKEQQQQQLQQVQINHIYSPTNILRRVPVQHYRHHLHQRAAPSTIIASAASNQNQHNKMSYCDGNAVFQNLHKQINTSLSYIEQLCNNYFRDRGNETFETMSKTWKFKSLETSNPSRKPIDIDDKLNKEILEFYLNLYNFVQLIDYATQDTNDNKTKIEHGEQISIDKITTFFHCVKKQLKHNMDEAEILLDLLAIKKPDLNDKIYIVEFNKTTERRVRDFLIIKDLIEEFKRIARMLNDIC